MEGIGLLWIGIDSGSAQLTVAVEDAHGHLLAVDQVISPSVNEAGVSTISRVERLLTDLAQIPGEPVCLVGAASQEVASAFEQAGWTVADRLLFNDVVNHYGLGPMHGNTVVAACGSGIQVVWFDGDSNVRWPGDDVAAACPEWLLVGKAYARFLRSHFPETVPDAELLSYRNAAEWRALGARFAAMVDHSAVRDFLEEGADRAAETLRVFADAAGSRVSGMTFSGGAVSDDGVWAVIHDALSRRGVHAERLRGTPARGAIAFARRFADRDFWGWFGATKPEWLSWSKEDWARYYATRP